MIECKIIAEIHLFGLRKRFEIYYVIEYSNEAIIDKSKTVIVVTDIHYG